MRPKNPRRRIESSVLQGTADQIINMKHELLLLAGKID